MVAETHSHNEGIEASQIAAFVIGDLGGLDESLDAATTTLRECGFELTLDIVQLAQLVGEEFGERTLTSGDLDELDGTSTVDDFIVTMFGELDSPDLD